VRFQGTSFVREGPPSRAYTVHNQVPTSSEPSSTQQFADRGEGLYSKSLLEVAHSAMNKLCTPRTRPTRKIIPLHKRNAQSPRRSIQGTPRARRTSSNNQHIESVAPFQRRELFFARRDAREGRWIGDRDGRGILERPTLRVGDGDYSDGEDRCGREGGQWTATGQRRGSAAEGAGRRV
jgi:hypothetical protein